MPKSTYDLFSLIFSIQALFWMIQFRNSKSQKNICLADVSGKPQWGSKIGRNPEIYRCAENPRTKFPPNQTKQKGVLLIWLSSSYFSKRPSKHILPFFGSTSHFGVHPSSYQRKQYSKIAWLLPFFFSKPSRGKKIAVQFSPFEVSTPLFSKAGNPVYKVYKSGEGWGFNLARLKSNKQNFKQDLVVLGCWLCHGNENCRGIEKCHEEHWWTLNVTVCCKIFFVIILHLTFNHFRKNKLMKQLRLLVNLWFQEFNRLHLFLQRFRGKKKEN